ncbi:MAG: CoA transferase, partial [Chloroflexi bacterium]|nr:CoA transferase [Chloroflexota bacterium]
MSLPLSGVRVLDFTRNVAGPYATLMLGDLGAEIIKVEEPDRGDGTRTVVTYEGRRPEDEDYFYSLNRNKKSITLDLKHPEGRAIAEAVAARSDALLENFAPGAMARLGLDYVTLGALHPGLVYCSISGFGQTGPYCERRGLDGGMQAMSGYMSLIGEPDRPPLAAGLPIADTCAGICAALAVAAALFDRLATGRGRYVDVAMLDVMMAVMITRAAEYLSSGAVSARIGNENPL